MGTSLYQRFCRLGARVPLLSRTGPTGETRELAKAVRFLKPLMTLDVSGVLGGGRLLAIVLWVAVLSVFTLGRQSLLVSIPVSVLFPVLGYYAFVSYPISMMNSYRMGLSEESDMVFEQFVLVFQAGGTIFDAIELVARSQHPFLSKAFQQILRRIDDGAPPEKCLLEFARDQPSDDLRRYFTGVISALEQKTDLLDLLSGESFEADLALRSKNLELESRLLVVAALVTYIPMLVTLALALSGFTSSPLILLVAPPLVVLNALMRLRFSGSFSAYFDRPRQTSLVPPSQREIAVEYDDFLNFLILLGERLRLGNTLEVSLAELVNEVGPESRILLERANNAIQWESRSAREAMQLASEEAKGQRVANMMAMVAEMCEISATEAGARLVKIAGRLVKRSSVVKERDSIIAAQRIKVYLLNLTSAIVLGLLASLSPYLFIGSLMGGAAGFPSAGNPLDILPLLITLVIVSGFSGYQNSLMVNGSRPRVVGLACAFLFWLAFAFSSSMLSGGLA